MREFKGTEGKWEMTTGTASGFKIISSSAPKSRSSVANCGGGRRKENARLMTYAPEIVKFIAELMDEQGDKLKDQESWIYYRAKDLLDKAIGDE